MVGGAEGQTGLGTSAAGYCATTPDPAACEQLLNSAISQGLVPQGATSGQLPIPGDMGGAVNGIEPGPPPSITVTPIPAASRRQHERSHLEEIYSQRAGVSLDQFGYDLVGNGGTISALQIGAIQDDYILGQGDAITVMLRGQENATYNVFVDRDGNVTLPRLRPVSAAGRRFGDFRNELNAAIRQGYLQTQAYITIGQVRQISVNVGGEVQNPGVFALSGLSSMLDALNVAGGIRKSGSLREIYVERAGKRITVDLYRLLAPDGSGANVTLRQGDRIIVPPLGATVAVSGDVRRPGIYELPQGAREASARTVLALANGYQIRGTYRLTILRTRPDGTQQYVDTTGRPGAAVRDGELLVVNSTANYAAGSVTLDGNVRLPGVYALNRVHTLRDLLPGGQAFLPLTYMPFGFIIREDQKTLKRAVIPFSVQLLIDGKYNETLQSQDVVHILTFNAMRQLVALAANAVTPQFTPQNASQGGVQSAPLMPTQGGQTAFGQSMAPGAAPGSQPAGPGASFGGQSFGNQAYSGGQSSGGQFSGGQFSGGQFSGGQFSGGQTATGFGQSATSQPGNFGSTPLSGFGAGGTVSAPGGPGFSQSSAAAGPGNSAGPQGGASPSADAGSQPSNVEGLTVDEANTAGFVVADYRVTLEGAVREPGDYLAVPGVPLDEVIDAANGLRPDADLNSVEITSTTIDNTGGLSVSSRKTYALTPRTLASVSLNRLDVVHIPPVLLAQEEGSMTVTGEVQFPGAFHLLRGEHLSSVLQRAGGLTRQAFPIGAVFQRVSVANVREAAYQREADDLEKQLMASVAQGGNSLAAASGQQGGLSAEAAAFVAGVIRELRTKPADGRMSVVADPAALAANPQEDIELQPGDQITIPKRPSEVDVTGEVLNPGSFRFSPRLSAADYIELSGGYDRYADEDHIFVVNPDGTSRRVSDDLFDFEPAKLAPGSVLVVPRDLRPLDLGLLTVTVTKVMSDLAISAASLAVLSKSN